MKILALPDTHFPFAQKRAIRKVLREVLSEIEFSHIIQLGDLLDQYSFTRFAKRNLWLPEKEIKLGREQAQEFWGAVRSKQPKAKCYQLLGNHDVRMIKRCQERLPEAQDVVRDSLLELYEFDGVHTVKDPRNELILGDIAFLHGYKMKLGDHTRFMHMKTVHGHTHRGGVMYMPLRKKILWELDCGYLADPSKEPLAYHEQRTTNWTLGYGIIDQLGPRFVPISL